MLLPRVECVRDKVLVLFVELCLLVLQERCELVQHIAHARVDVPVRAANDKLKERKKRSEKGTNAGCSSSSFWCSLLFLSSPRQDGLCICYVMSALCLLSPFSVNCKVSSSLLFLSLCELSLSLWCLLRYLLRNSLMIRNEYVEDVSEDRQQLSDRVQISEGGNGGDLMEREKKRRVRRGKKRREEEWRREKEEGENKRREERLRL